MRRLVKWFRLIIHVVEVRVLAMWIALVTSAWVFVRLASEVSEGDVDSLDRKMLLFFRVPGNPTEPIGPLWLQEAMRDITALGGFTLLTIISVAGLSGLMIYGKRCHAAIFLMVVAGAQVSSEVLKTFYDRPRPDLTLHLVRVYSGSFPSGHSTSAAATFFTLAAIISTLETRRRGKQLVLSLAIILTIAVGVSRVYLGVHWPSDVLAGWIVGGGWALAAWTALTEFEGRRPSETAKR